MGSIDHARLSGAERSVFHELQMVFRVAIADYFHEKRLSLPLIISLSAVLTPLLVLFGLKFGIISTMGRELTEDPRSRELRPLGQSQYDVAWMDQLRRRPDVAFVMPKTRFLAATIDLRNPDEKLASPVNTELTPSAQGDPLLETMEAKPDGFESIVISTSVAEALRAGVGDRIEGRIGRTLSNGERDVIRLDLRIAGILPAGKSGRMEALVSLPLLLAAEDFREGYQVREFGAEGRSRPQGRRLYASFRLYARSIHDVAVLRQWLADRDVRSDTRLGEIELLERLDRSLSILYFIVAGLGGCGYLISMTVSLWANTERKRKELSVLRLIGLRSTSLVLVPCIQSVCTAICGSIIAFVFYWGGEQLINHLFREQLAAKQVVSRLEFHHLAAAAGATLIFAVIASLMAGFRAASISPSEGLRDE